MLPQSSCEECARITGAFEGVCQRTMLGPLRMYFDLPSRRRKDRPEKLALKVKVRLEDEWSFMEVPQEEYPFLILLPTFGLPDEISSQVTTGERGAKARTLWIRGASFAHGITEHLEQLAQRLGVAMIEPTATLHVPEFLRMLAKVAHCYAVGELGVDAFTPFLLPIIRDNVTDNSIQFIGGVKSTERAVADLHQLSIVTHPSVSPNLIMVRVRLLACLETPTYAVAVGRR